MFEKLQADYQRFLEIERSLLDPEVTADSSRVTALAKERGTLAKIALPYGRYLELGRQIAEAEQLCAAETDCEMRSYAEAELDGLRARQRQEGEELRDLLYDRSAGTGHAALIVEIRAGTGGDEAALFARDLFEMYRRFAETDGLEVRDPRPRADRAGRLPRGLVQRRRARVPTAISSSRAASTASSACRRPRPRAGFTPRPLPSPCCPSPRKSTW